MLAVHVLSRCVAYLPQLPRDLILDSVNRETVKSCQKRFAEYAVVLATERDLDGTDLHHELLLPVTDTLSAVRGCEGNTETRRALE